MKKVLMIMLAMMMLVPAIAQHHLKGMKGMDMDKHEKKRSKTKAPRKKPKPAATPAHDMTDMDMADMQDDTTMQVDHSMSDMGDSSMGNMNHYLSLHLPMARNGSGTSWNPDDAPIYMYMLHSRKWMFMFHGNFFIRYNHQDISGKGIRGDEGWDAPNMLMAMGQRQIGKKGLFHFGAMFSLDVVFTGQKGYPLLFQTGESAHGLSLVDRQHPHDLFSALEVSYAYSFSKMSDAYIYLGYPGEPALGATTFMHRASGMDNPDAPLSHHWVDATHITFGVATLGYRYGRFKIEGSSFTGREPNENRYDFDRPTFDSRSARLWYNPNSSWSFQVSLGFIRSPEALHPDEDVYRTAASASYSKKFGQERFLNATGLWGMNKQKEHDAEHAGLLEASLRMNGVVVYTRYEYVQKSVGELNLDEQVYGREKIFPVNAITLGAAYDLLHGTPVWLSLGAQTSLYHADEQLNGLYGRNPMTAEAYLRFYPNLMSMSR